MTNASKPEAGEVGCEATCRLCGAPRPDSINHIWACCGDGPGYGNAIKPEKLACVESQLAATEARVAELLEDRRIQRVRAADAEIALTECQSLLATERAAREHLERRVSALADELDKRAIDNNAMEREASTHETRVMSCAYAYAYRWCRERLLTGTPAPPSEGFRVGQPVRLIDGTEGVVVRPVDDPPSASEGPASPVVSFDWVLSQLGGLSFPNAGGAYDYMAQLRPTMSPVAEGETGVLSAEDYEAFQQLLNAPPRVLPGLVQAMRNRRARLDALRSQPTPTGEERQPYARGINNTIISTASGDSGTQSELAESAVTSDVAPVVENTGHLSCAFDKCANQPLPGSRRCYDHQPQRCPSPVAPAALSREALASARLDGETVVIEPVAPAVEGEYKTCGCWPPPSLLGGKHHKGCELHIAEPPPVSPPASDADGGSKFKPRCMVLVRGVRRCIKDEGHGPDNELGDVVHQDERGELFCEQAKLACPSQSPPQSDDVLTRAAAVSALERLASLIGEGCDLEPALRIVADELARQGGAK